MKKYNCLVFDFDGTLADTKEGVLNSISFALSKINIKCELDESVVGPSPFFLYTNIFKLDKNLVNKCVENHRKYGDKKGYRESRCYDGVQNLLECLKRDGYHLYIVSSKKDFTLKKICRYLKLDAYFNGIYGVVDEQINKGNLLAKCILSKFDREEVLYIGDTKYDYDAAKSNEVDFCFAEYGYGKINENITCWRIRCPQDLVFCLKNYD